MVWSPLWSAVSGHLRDDDGELKNLQKRIGQVENESLDSTNRALRALNEAQETGAKTAQVINKKNYTFI